jgi:hypothetical protein
MAVVIEGENLNELSRALKEWKVEWLAEFDPEEHEPLTDPKAPYIKSITITTPESEEPLATNQRH